MSPHPPAHPNPRTRHAIRQNQGVKQAGGTPPNELPQDTQTASSVHDGELHHFWKIQCVIPICLQALAIMINQHKSFFNAKECLKKKNPCQTSPLGRFKILDLAEGMQDCHKQKQSRLHGYQLGISCQPSDLWLFPHGTPSKLQVSR
jgi:hypothetical protein